MGHTGSWRGFLRGALDVPFCAFTALPSEKEPFPGCLENMTGFIYLLFTYFYVDKTKDAICRGVCVVSSESISGLTAARVHSSPGSRSVRVAFLTGTYLLCIWAVGVFCM